MTAGQLVLIAIGHLTLAGTFVLGVLVGVSMKKGQNDYGRNEGTQAEWWRDIERRRFEECSRRCQPGGAKPGTQAHPDERASG
jgi:hypothetical protein